MSPFFRKLKSLIPSQRRAEERDMREELAALEHIAGEIGGRRELGNLTAAAEQARAVTGFPILHGIVTDIRYSLRGLRKDPAFTGVAVASLALGIAANVSIFGLMDSLLWRELPVTEPERIVSFANCSHSYFGYLEFVKNSTKALEDVIAQSPATETATSRGSEPSRAQVEFVSGNYFSALGVKPVHGRLISPRDTEPRNPAQVAVLSYAYWRKMFNADPDAMGHSLHAGEGNFEIAGVAPEDFFGLSVGEAPDIWLPITAQPTVSPRAELLAGRNNNWLYLFGRLRSDMTAKRAEAILTPVSVEIDIERNGSAPTAAERKAMLEDTIRLLPASKGVSFLRDRFSKPLQVVFGLLAVGLLLACVNVVSLQIARANERQKEFAIRLAIGAARLRILRQCLTEALILALASALAGCLFFRPASSGIVSLITLWSGEPARLDLGLHPEVILFVIVLCVAVMLLSGLLPAIYSSRRTVQPGLQSGSPATAPKRQRGIVRTVGVIQITVSIVIITGTCLFAGSLQQLRRFDSGIRRDGLFEAELDPMRVGATSAAAVELDARLRERFLGIPGVENVTFSQNGIYSGRNSDSDFEADGFHPNDSHLRHGMYDYAGPEFFATLGTKIIAGRDFNAGDNTAAPKVVIINQTFADRVFPNQNALGRNLYLPEACRVVGVVRDIRSDIRESQVAWYLPALQHSDHPFSTSFLIRTKNNRELSIRELTAAATAENPNLRIGRFETAERLLDGTLDTDRLMARLGWALGILSVSLASIGIYGLVSYDLTRRTGEIGIRAALGACPADILKLVLSELAVMLLLGAGFGGCGAMILSGFARGLVFGIDLHDPRFELLGAAILLAAALTAAAFPARRAARLDPMRSLRAD